MADRPPKRKTMDSSEEAEGHRPVRDEDEAGPSSSQPSSIPSVNEMSQSRRRMTRRRRRRRRERRNRDVEETMVELPWIGREVEVVA